VATKNSRTVPFPLTVTARPRQSNQVLFVMSSVLESVIVPSHVNVTVPPPAIAARKSASVQFATTPPPRPDCKPTKPHSTAKNTRIGAAVFIVKTNGYATPFRTIVE
jgi:hypothetical protein